MAEEKGKLKNFMATKKKSKVLVKMRLEKMKIKKMSKVKKDEMNEKC